METVRGGWERGRTSRTATKIGFSRAIESNVRFGTGYLNTGSRGRF